MLYRTVYLGFTFYIILKNINFIIHLFTNGIIVNLYGLIKSNTVINLFQTSIAFLNRW